jgi:hypothetical protein
MIQKSRHDQAREFWRVFCGPYLREHPEQMRSLAHLTDAHQLQATPFLQQHPFA